MTTFLLYTLTLVCLGIFIRIFWVPLAIIGGILMVTLGILISAGITALTIEVIHAMITGGTWTGFSTYFVYSAVFYIVLTGIYIGIMSDIFATGVKFISTFLRNRH